MKNYLLALYYNFLKFMSFLLEILIFTPNRYLFLHIKNIKKNHFSSIKNIKGKRSDFHVFLICVKLFYTSIYYCETLINGFILNFGVYICKYTWEIRNWVFFYLSYKHFIVCWYFFGELEFISLSYFWDSGVECIHLFSSDPILWKYTMYIVVTSTLLNTKTNACYSLCPKFMFSCLRVNLSHFEAK